MILRGTSFLGVIPNVNQIPIRHHNLISQIWLQSTTCTFLRTQPLRSRHLHLRNARLHKVLCRNLRLRLLLAPLRRPFQPKALLEHYWKIRGETHSRLCCTKQWMTKSTPNSVLVLGSWPQCMLSPTPLSSRLNSQSTLLTRIPAAKTLACTKLKFMPLVTSKNIR